MLATRRTRMRTASIPRSHSGYGGIERVTSSRSRATRASTSWRSNASTYRSTRAPAASTSLADAGFEVAVAEDGTGAAKQAFNRFGAGVKEHEPPRRAFQHRTSRRISAARCFDGELLQRRHERQPNALAPYREIGGVVVWRGAPGHRGPGRPTRARAEARPEQRIARRRRAELHRQRPPAAGLEHVDADIGGDSETATTAAPPAPRSGRAPARHARASPARRPRPRTASRACGSSSQSERTRCSSSWCSSCRTSSATSVIGASSDGRGRRLAAAAMMQATYPTMLS